MEIPISNEISMNKKNLANLKYYTKMSSCLANLRIVLHCCIPPFISCLFSTLNHLYYFVHPFLLIIFMSMPIKPDTDAVFIATDLMFTL